MREIGREGQMSLVYTEGVKASERERERRRNRKSDKDRGTEIERNIRRGAGTLIGIEEETLREE